MYFQNNIQEHLSGLNDQQRDAVLCRSRIVYVSAGPGSGKTHMLTSKLIDYIVSSSSPQKIVALSYTNTAAREIGDRFRKKASGITSRYSFYNGTIHSFCYRMMRLYKDTAFDYTILDDEELSELAEDIKASLHSDIPQSLVMGCLRSDPSQSGSELFKSVTEVKKALKVISVQDILTLFIGMLDSDASFREWISSQVTVMAVDEAQDLSELNYIILDRLLAIIPALQVFIVGDPRQNIFEFNGGSYKHLDAFLSKHPDHETKTLTLTYRCGKPIADFVNKFSFLDCKNYSLQSMNRDGSLSVMDASSEKEEADMVCKAVMDSRNISSCAVLTNNLRYLDPLITRLQWESIPYRVFGGVKVIKRHIRFLNHILRIVDSENAYSIRKISQYAGIDIFVNGRRNKAKFFDSELGQIIRSISEDSKKGASFTCIASRVLEEIMKNPSDDEEVTADYELFLALAGEYNTVPDYLASFATDKEKFASFYNSDIRECPIPTEEGYLTISTIHSAKGLEWDTVFIMGLCEGNFPNPYFCKSLPPDKQQEFFNSEWKKMYVAATRARKRLFLTYPSSITRKGYTFRKDPSRFLRGTSTSGTSATRSHLS
ncbi:MAG: ATP-dependent helicase [Bacteroidales bacterium]|nr:ATP-dependent helicase [Bacteroidales bacterium]